MLPHTLTNLTGPVVGLRIHSRDEQIGVDDYGRRIESYRRLIVNTAG